MAKPVAKYGKTLAKAGPKPGQRKAAPKMQFRGQVKAAGPRKSPGGLSLQGGSVYSTRTGKLVGPAGARGPQASSQSLGSPGLDFFGIGNAVKNFLGNTAPQDALMKNIGKRIKKATSTGR